MKQKIKALIGKIDLKHWICTIIAVGMGMWLYEKYIAPKFEQYENEDGYFLITLFIVLLFVLLIANIISA